jgi:hypothetical protein
MEQIFNALEKINGMDAIFSFDKKGKVIATKIINKNNFALENLLSELKKIFESPILLENQSSWFQFSYADLNLLLFSINNHFLGCIFHKEVELALIRLTLNVALAKKT